MTNRIDIFELRPYNSIDDSGEDLVPSAAIERKIKLDEQEHRASGYLMRRISSRKN